MKQKSVAKHGNHQEGAGIDRKLHDPVADRLIPLEPLDLAKIRSIDDLVRAMSRTAFTGRQLGEAADVLEAMAREPGQIRLTTLRPVLASSVASPDLVVRRLIERGLIYRATRGTYDFALPLFRPYLRRRAADLSNLSRDERVGEPRLCSGTAGCSRQLTPRDGEKPEAGRS